MTMMPSDEFRALDLNEIAAVSGGTTGWCSGKVTATIKVGDKGTLDMGYDECVPGVRTPWAIWTPSDKK
jgi:hypothetical protein